MASVSKRCGHADKARCKCNWVVRYRVGGKQREKSYLHDQKTLANDFALKIEHDKRAGVFTDPKSGAIPFVEYAAKHIDQMPRTATTRRAYMSALRNHIGPWAGNRTLAQVAADREGAVALVNETMAGKSVSNRTHTSTVLMAVVSEAVRAGRLSSHRLAGLKLTQPETVPDRSDFVFPSRLQVSELADRLNGAGIAVWLMRGCGLRINEALAVERGDFRDGGKTLRVTGQVTPDGRKKVPLKHRRAGEYRDVPVPAYLWEMVKDLPDGPVVLGRSLPYRLSQSIRRSFTREHRNLGIPEGFTPHSLRHAFASALLARGVPITDVAAWLGHKSINVTFGIYGHLIPSAAGRARDALEAEYEEWQ